MTSDGELREIRPKEQKRSTPEMHHGFSVTDRSSLALYGIKDVKRFDEGEVSLVTELGSLEIEGRDMKVTVLDLEKGRVAIEGHIDAMIYSDVGEKKSTERRGILGRFIG